MKYSSHDVQTAYYAKNVDLEANSQQTSPSSVLLAHADELADGHPPLREKLYRQNVADYEHGKEILKTARVARSERFIAGLPAPVLQGVDSPQLIVAAGHRATDAYNIVIALATK